MPFTRLYATQDSYISRKSVSSNFGAEQSLTLSTSSANSCAIDSTRLLIQFPIDSVTGTLTGTYSAILNLFNARNDQFTDQNFSIEIYPITSQWNEGIGSVFYPLSTSVNYLQRTSTSNWSTSGGDYNSSISSVITFPNGTENLTANLSAFVTFWNTNPNYGLLLKFPSSIESLTSNYSNTKSFFGRSSHTIYRPYIDLITHETLLKDDRNNLHLGNNNIFFIDKNVSGNTYPGGAYVKSDLTISSGTGYTMNYFSPNVWYIQFNNDNLQWDGLWSVLSNTASNYSITSAITGTLQSTFFVDDIERINVNIYSKNDYMRNENTSFKVKIYNYRYVGMGSVAVDYYPASAFLFFLEKNSRKVITPEMEMGWNLDGYFTKFNMNNLLPGYYYIPVVKIVDGINSDTIYREIPEGTFYIKDLQNQYG